jgi:glycosyltransferase 2 family protein
MRITLRQLWPWAKALLAVAIVGGVGWQFAHLLGRPELWEQSLQPEPGWLVAGAILYVAAFGFPFLFWVRLLRVLGARPPVGAALRAYAIAHLGKYVPGKAWALVLRTTLIRSSGVGTGLAVLTATYETLTLMASGALVAVVLLSVQALESADRWKAAGLLVLAGVPILPGVFNRLVALATRSAETIPPPRVANATLLSGLGMTACTWAVMGLSLGVVVHGIVPEAPPWGLESWARHTAFVSLAYVAGFLTLPAPGGLGVRELILQRLLTPELSLLVPAEQAGPLAVVVVLLLRLVWTAAEVFMAGAACFLRAPVGHDSISGVEQPKRPACTPEALP